jgi:hypothetical protein
MAAYDLNDILESILSRFFMHDTSGEKIGQEI